MNAHRPTGKCMLVKNRKRTTHSASMFPWHTNKSLGQFTILTDLGFLADETIANLKDGRNGSRDWPSGANVVV